MKTCPKCNIDHNKPGTFCSRSCANSRGPRSDKVKQKISKSKIASAPPNKIYKRVCNRCGTKFEEPHKHHTRNYCSDKCRKQSWKEHGSINGRKGAAANNKRSKNEILFAELCLEHFDNVLTNEPMFNGWDADVILTDLRIAILWNGIWHYNKITENHSVKQVQNRDKIKIKEIKNLGYYPYIIKDLGGYNPEFVKQEFNTFKQNIGDVAYVGRASDSYSGRTQFKSERHHQIILT